MTDRSTHHVATIVAAGLLLCAAARAGDSERPAAGAYEITTATTYTDVELPATTITTTSCLSAEDLDRDPASALAALPAGDACSVVESVMEGGAIQMRIVCDMSDGSMVMATNGSYDRNGWDMVNEVTVTVGGDQVKMHATITGRRTGDC